MGKLTLTLSGVLVLFLVQSSSALAQEETETAGIVEETAPTGNVVNSKALYIISWVDK